MIMEIDLENIEAEEEELKKMIADREAKKGLEWDPEQKQWVPTTMKHRKQDPQDTAYTKKKLTITIINTSHIMFLGKR